MATPSPIHFVALPWMSPGHVNPLLHVCNKLISSANFRITFVNTLDNHKRMFQSIDPVTKDGIDFVPVLEPKAGENESGIFPAGLESLDLVVQSTYRLEPAVRELVRGMIESGVAIKGIIADSFFPWIKDLAAEFKMVSVAFSTISATVELICFHMRRFRAEGFTPVKTRTTGDKLIEFIPGLPSFSPFDIPFAFYNEHPIIDLITVAYEKIKHADWILSSTVEEVEPETVSIIRRHFITKNNYLPIGPFLPEEHITGSSSRNDPDRDRLTADEIKCLEWLDSRPDSSVLYVAFGSVAVLSSEQFQELVSGLETSSIDQDVGILWSMRSNFVEGEFPQEMLDRFLERSGSDRVRVVPWAPQMRVLRHRAVGGFLTHCGWNSTLESVCAGVAMIGWPCQSEQNSNCSFLAWNKLALRVKDRDHVGSKGGGGVVGKEEITKAVNELMVRGEVGEEIRRNVGELKEKVKMAAARGGSSDANFRVFVEAMW